MNFKEYRISRKLTQAQAGALLGMSASFWCTLEAGKESAEKERAFARILTYLGDPRLQLPLTKERLVSVKAYGITQQDASQMIGAGRNTWSNLLNSHCPINARWTLLCNALLIELEEKEREFKKQAELDLLPSGDIEIIQPSILTPAPETDVQPWNPAQSGDPLYVKMSDWIAKTPPAQEPEISDQTLIPFFYGSQSIRCKIVNNEPWWVLRDVCGAIGYKWAGDAVDLIEEEDLEKIQTLTSGGYQNMVFVNEPGLYQLLARTRIESAKVFQRWLFKEVLPQIRKTGQYSTAPAQPAQVDPLDAIILSLTEIKAVKVQQAEMAATIEAQAQQIKQIEQRTPIDPRHSAKLTLLELQALNSKKAELHKLKAAIVHQAERNTDDFSLPFRKHGNVWRYIHSQAVPAVASLNDYTTQAQLNTAIDAAQVLLTRLGGTLPVQLSINIDGGVA